MFYIMKIFKRYIFKNKIIDFGCGKGNFLKDISNNKNFMKISGIDISLEILNQSI